MLRHLISNAHEWINKIPSVPIYFLAKPLPREGWKKLARKEDLLSLTNLSVHSIGGLTSLRAVQLISHRGALHLSVERHSYCDARGEILVARRMEAKAFAKNVYINRERKLEFRRRSDTVLVLTINDASQRSAEVPPMTRRAASGKPKLLGSMVAKLKLKGIDGRPPPEVEPAA
ncbi:hypothetical protein APICC_10118 [Apis cerana cerana]|uniref:Uncharacterized protein n=1 Tax=Apis cerana cerana TaxID=94128 RepID=A0A2A3E062_APICC|nr:hypothetical protein APICC_10118 [Apis cerana cerana]